MEHFFIKSPITDYALPMDLSEWFDPERVFSKRFEIAQLMKQMILEQNEQPIELPNIIFFKEDDPDLQVPVVDSASQSQQENGNVNFDENNCDNNGNVDENGNGDENGNNNESAFNNNNDFYEMDHNAVVQVQAAVNANVDQSHEELHTAEPMIMDQNDFDEQQRSPIVSLPPSDGVMTDDEDDVVVASQSHNSVIQKTPPSGSSSENDKKNLSMSRSVILSDEVIDIDDSDDEGDSPMPSEASKANLDDEVMAGDLKSTPETKNDSQVTGNQL